MSAEALIREVMRLKNDPQLLEAMDRASKACAPVKALDIIYDTIRAACAGKRK